MRVFRATDRGALVALVLLAAVGLAGASPARGAAVRKETVESVGQKRVVHVYAPDGLAPDTPVPLLILLHGSNGDGASILKRWKTTADDAKVILAAPNALEPAGWGIPEDGPQLLGDIVEFMKARFPVDARRIYLFGHSAGAVFALTIGPMESELFAAVAVHAGAFRDGPSSRVLGLARRKVPVLLIVGDRDPLFPVGVVRVTREALDALGFPGGLVEIPRHDHDYYRRSGEVNRKAWTFLSAQRLESEGTFRSYTFRTGPPARD